MLKTLDGVYLSVIFNACICWSTRLTHLSWSLTQYWDHSITTIITLHVTLFKCELSRVVGGGSDEREKLLAGSQQYKCNAFSLHQLVALYLYNQSLGSKLEWQIFSWMWQFNVASIRLLGAHQIAETPFT